MAKIVRLLLALLFLVPGPALAMSSVSTGVLAAEVRTDLNAKLLSQGIPAGQVSLDLNVPVEIKDQPRTDANNQPVRDGNGNPIMIPGVKLWAILLRPAGDAARPTIIIPTCYRREVFLPFYAGLVKHGYNVLVLDVRGSGSSNGQWTALDFNEHYDIAYVIDTWLEETGSDNQRLRAWHDGRVGMVGPSYLGITQLLAAGNIQRNAQGEPTHLKAIFPIIPMSDTYKDIVMHGGNVNIEFMLFWLGLTDFLAILPPLSALGDEFPPDLTDFQAAAALWQDHLSAVSLHAGWLADDANIPNDGDFYDRRSTMMYWPVKPDPDDPYGGWAYPEGGKTFPAKLPVFLTGGWYCIFTRGECNHYQFGLSAHARGDKALLVGPWYHLEAFLGLGIAGMMNTEIPARWFDLKIKGEGESFMTDYPVLLYVMGTDRWRAEQSWPLPPSRVQDKTYYLSRQAASMIEGDWFSTWNQAKNYSLTDAVSVADYTGDSPVLRHDPPLFHGLTSRSAVRWLMGFPAILSQIQRYLLGQDVEARQTWEDERLDEVGVLTFTTEPLDTDVEIAGPLKLSFWAQTEFDRPLTQAMVDQTFAFLQNLLQVSDDKDLLFDLMNRKDVQWIVEINDVFPDGRAKNITSGWLSAWHRPYDPQNPARLDPAYRPFDPFYDRADKHPSPIEAGVVYPYVVEIWPTDNVFKQGHRIRVSISASDFPHILPVLHPSKNTFVMDGTEHQARLDCQVVNSTPSEAWQWVSDMVPSDDGSQNQILREFSAVNTYLLTHTDTTVKSTAESANSSNGSTQSAAAGSDGGGSSGGACFIAIAGGRV